MRQKSFSKEYVEETIKWILKRVKSKKLNGKVFSLTEVIGDYQYDYAKRCIKEVLFEAGESFGRNGAEWWLSYPNETPKQLTKRVMAYTRDSAQWFHY